MRVAVIGAGPAGLAALKVFQDVVDADDLVAFDSQEDIGGTWLYSESSESWFASAVYANLRTNLPPEQMQYPSMDFPDGTDQFPHHSVVHKYLVAFADRFNLRRFIRLNTTVEGCSFNDGVWLLRLSDGTQHEADKVILSNGHFRLPHFPLHLDIDPSIASFHSRQYRRPDAFHGKVVVLVGAGTSAFDIAREIAPQAERVYISMRDDSSAGDLGETVDQLRPTRKDGSLAEIVAKGALRRTGPDGLVQFEDGSTVSHVHTIIWATGFDFTFPFMQLGESSESTQLVDTTGAAVYNLYREMMYIPNPTLAILGVNHRIWPFPVFEYQATLLSLYWTNALPLPTRSDMRAHEQGEAARWGYLPGSKESHRFGPDRQYAYLSTIYDDLVATQPVPSLPKPISDPDRRAQILRDRKLHLGY
ncbi:hypothetical protein DYB30_006541 [Aphanomyces astaci]|uniref:Flavin-containing monooxygenase n=1 Tax=Aphanomyces astaci TaxID=112090 RepID=A0A397D2R5_APHAT|nr:hypothetical protein DYB30_006541 [Aphanomyces astaci]RHZ10428.1 hypothetical protein DYB31_001434 [Aphanomyces astaci]